MPDRRGLVRAALAAPSLWLPRVQATAAELDALFARFAALGERRASFVERRHSVLFRTPPEVRGTLWFKPPALLERDVTAPRRERVRIDGDTVTLTGRDEQGGETVRRMSLPSIPQLAVLAQTIRATLAGDLAGLRRMYTVELQQPPPDWRVVLVPLAPAEAELAGPVQSIRVAGRGADVARIEVLEASGDRTELLLTPQR
jgi:outer membrane lipoprotein-sorting protein